MSGKWPCLVRVEDGVAWRLEPGKRYGLGRDLCNHFVANSSSVAMRHLELWVERGQVWLEDAGLAPLTVVDGEVLDGSVRRVGPGTGFETGSVAWRISADEPDALAPTVFTLESARRRLIEGAKQKMPYRRWTRGWKDLHGRPIAGLLGRDGGAFWFRVFAQELEWDDEPLDVYTALAEEAPRSVTHAEARAVMERRFLRHAADAPIAFTLSEMFGPSAALDMMFAPNVRVLHWLGAFPEADVQQVIAGLKEADEIMAVAMNANMPAAGLRRVRQLRSNTWEVERWMLETSLPPETLFALAEEFEMSMGGSLVTHLVAHGSDDLVTAIHEAVASGRTSARVSALSDRPLPQFAAAMLRAHVREIGSDDPRTPIPREVVEFCENGGDVAAAVLVDAFDEMPEPVAETFAMMRDERLTQIWPDLPAALRDAIESRFGAPTSDLPELPKSHWTPWMHRWARNSSGSQWKGYHRGGPQMATRDGFRLPASVERGLYCALKKTEFAFGQMTYDEHLLEVRRDIEPRSAMRSMWWQWSRRREGHHHTTRCLMEAGAAFLLEDRDLVEVALHTHDMMEHELRLSEAPIVPLLLWLRGWDNYKRVPYAVRPPPDWSKEANDPDDEVFDEWPEGTFEELTQFTPPPRPEFWDVPADLAEDDWSRFTDWVIARLPAKLPVNADDLARRWLRANAIDRTLFGLDQWRRLISETWLAEIRDELIWIALIGDQPKVFRMDGDDCVDVGGDVIELEPEARLHLAHPLDLDRRSRVDWAQHLAEHEIASLFDQLDTAGLQEQPAVESFVGREARPLWMDGWDRDELNAPEGAYLLCRDFGTRGRAVAEVRDETTVGLRFFDLHGAEVALDALDPVVQSQTFADFEYALSRWSL